MKPKFASCSTGVRDNSLMNSAGSATYTMNVFSQPSASTGWRVMRAATKPITISPNSGRISPSICSICQLAPRPAFGLSNRRSPAGVQMRKAHGIQPPARPSVDR
jgi:hypothetical protein